MHQNDMRIYFFAECIAELKIAKVAKYYGSDRQLAIIIASWSNDAVMNTIIIFAYRECYRHTE